MTPQTVQPENVVQMLFVVTLQEDFPAHANQDLQGTLLLIAMVSYLLIYRVHIRNPIKRIHGLTDTIFM